MPCIQIMDNGQSLDYFIAIANNVYEKIKPLVHNTGNNEFSFNFCVIQKMSFNNKCNSCCLYS